MALSSVWTPYFLLGLLVCQLFLNRSLLVSRVIIALTLGAAFNSGIVDATGLLSVLVFWGVCELHWWNPSSIEWVNSLRLFLITALAIGFSIHKVPGFHNLRVLEAVKLSPSSLPYTQYLNFDKTIVAAIIVAASGLLVGQRRNPFFLQTIGLAGLCIALLAVMATATGYVRFDPKFPSFFWLWAANNLLFVCFAEEVIFRGVVQNRLAHLCGQRQICPYASVLLTAVLFGFLHYQGGIPYITFATFAGLFYGYAYQKTGRLEAAIGVHFLVNLCHFLLFSYPAAVPLP